MDFLDIKNLKEKNQKLEDIISKLPEIFDTMAELLAYQDTNNTIIWANKAAAESVGLKQKELTGKKCYKIWHGRNTPCIDCPVKEAVKTGKPKKRKITSPDGRHWLISGYPVKREDGTVKSVVEVTTELTDIVEKEIELKKSEERYRSIFDNSIDGIYITTPEGRYVDVNTTLVKMLGYESKEKLMSIDIKKELYVSEKERPEPKNRDRIFETRLRKKDKSIIDVEISSRVIYEDGKPKYYEGIVRDISERKKTERQLKYLSFHDKLTGLYNRAYFEEELKRLDRKRQLPISFIIGDVNGLKLINDTFGHLAGDKLLIEVAKLLKKFFRKEDVIARWGGDEFSFLLPKTTRLDAEKIVERIKKACEKKYYNKKIPISISFGISTKIKASNRVETVLKETENNMYKSKLVDKRSVFSSMVSSLERAMHEKSYETEEHAERLIVMAIKLGKAINLSESKLDELSLLATLHDIGKVAISENILLKKTKLTKKELGIVKKHSEIGYNITQSSPHLTHIADAILFHHEWWDGSGYPQGIKGEDIPVISRIISIVDAYDVMLTGRPYKKSLSKKEAIEELKRYSGTQFDPRLVEKFIEIVEKN